jgi:hypothetical protein
MQERELGEVSQRVRFRRRRAAAARWRERASNRRSFLRLLIVDIIMFCRIRVPVRAFSLFFRGEKKKSGWPQRGAKKVLYLK